MIESYLDEHFREIIDNWWMALRHDLRNYDEFKVAFKARYWSEATQNIVRDNICHGRYDASKGTTLTAYFLGKCGWGETWSQKSRRKVLSPS